MYLSAAATTSAVTVTAANPPSAAAAFGARGPRRRPITRRLANRYQRLTADADLNGLLDSGATQPALPVVAPALAALTAMTAVSSATYASASTRPVVALMPYGQQQLAQRQDIGWRFEATQLAWQADMACRATWWEQAGCYTVPSTRAGSRRYRVTFALSDGARTLDDGVWRCACAPSSAGQPCHHVGAAILLYHRRAATAESVQMARDERLGWAWATPAVASAGTGNVDEHLAWYRMSQSRGRGYWDTVRIGWDTQHDVAIWCDCGAPVCAHVGAVALRVAKDRADAQRMRQLRWHA